MRKRPLAVLSVSVIVFCVAAEILALLIFYYQHGWLFYVYPYQPARAPIPQTAGGQLTREGLHPYFGPTHKPGIPFDIPIRALKWEAVADGQTSVRVPGVTTNNFGFSSRYDYPFVKSNNRQFVIGILGGSVGDWFCQLGARRLIEKLQENRFFGGRELVPICLSHEGYKQPQQLLVLAYFLSIGQPLDLVVNIGGFNEVTLSNMNDQRGFDISMPSAMHVDPLINLVNQSTLTPDKLESLAAINRLRQRLDSLADRLNRAPLASTNFVLEQLYAIVSRRYEDELRRFAALPSMASENSLIHLTPSVKQRAGPVIFEDIARNWVASSMLMHALLAARDVPYFDFLQPNQYYSRRTFTAAEAKIALSDESPFKGGVEAGYPALERELQSARMKNAGVNVFDATRIFDREPSPVYVDNCCHYTATGNRILADFIAGTILNSEGVWRD